MYSESWTERGWERRTWGSVVDVFIRRKEEVCRYKGRGVQTLGSSGDH